jgi:ribosome biogenesis GTPase / thiamine phosphate phosphatase
MNTDSAPRQHQGIVISKSIASYGVSSGGRTVACTLAPRLAGAARSKDRPGRRPDGGDRQRRGREDRNRLGERRARRGGDSGQPTPGLPVVGDVVSFVPTGLGAGQIVQVLPRRNAIGRRSAVPMPSAHAHEHLIVANIDQMVPVFAVAQPAPKWNLLDRYLALAESVGVPAVIVITKADLKPAPGADDLAEALEDYGRIGYTLVVTSAVDGRGLPAVRDALRGRVSVLLGKSGVGKTSLLNALEPGLGQRVAEVSQATGKGRHTTSGVQLFELAEGGALADTPGTREFGLWQADPATLDLCFREMRPLVGQCRFGAGCAHDEEPGCAIRQAVMDGRISPRLYRSYLRLRAEAGG